MLKIATHNSGTGEEASNFLSWLITPFAKCQSKTIRDQLVAGCTYLDLRVNKNLILSHGIWHSSVNLEKALGIVERYSDYHEVPINIMITYEGRLKDEEENPFIEKILEIVKNYPHLNLTCINKKKPVWKLIYTGPNYIGTKCGFVNLDGSTWHTLLPIPWLWKKIYHDNPEFNEEEYLMVDFL